MCAGVFAMLASLPGYGQRKVYEANFQNPPASTKPSVYWYWLNEHVTKEGITRDLEAMKRVGIGEAFIGNVYEADRVSGSLETLSDEWKEYMRHAIREASRLGIDLGIFNGPGWSQSGGPWVTTDEAMRYLTYATADIDGGTKVEVQLPKPDPEFKDVTVLAYPLETDEVRYKNITSRLPVSGLQVLLDNDPKTKICFPNKSNESLVFDIDLMERTTIRGLMVRTSGQGFNTDCELQVKRNGRYETVKNCFSTGLITAVSWVRSPTEASCDDLPWCRRRCLPDQPFESPGQFRGCGYQPVKFRKKWRKLRKSYFINCRVRVIRRGMPIIGTLRLSRIRLISRKAKK